MSEPQASYSVTYIDEESLQRAVQTELVRLRETNAATYKGPEPSLVRGIIGSIGLSRNEVADTLRVNVSTIRRYTAVSEQSQSRRMPFCAWVLLLQTAGYSLEDS